jgi:Fic family protein
LPPKLDLARLAEPLHDAALALGSLDGLGRALPDPTILVRSFLRVEAVASSKIEGTVTSVPELLALELSPNAPRVRNDTREVNNYSRALRKGLELAKSIPICTRMFCELHSVLMDGVRDERGLQVAPGELKTHQNWIGGRLIKNARFVPPPPADSVAALGDLETFINRAVGLADRNGLPLLAELALVHYQFETIHPFPDGNGRVGRLLIPIMLCQRKAMAEPLLYLSTYFEKHNDEYIDRMYAVSRSGEWEDWIEFFLRGVTASAHSGIRKANALRELRRTYMERVQSVRSSALLAKIIDRLFAAAATTIPIVANDLGISYNAAKNNIQRLIELRVLAPDIASDERPQWFYSWDIINTMSIPDDGDASTPKPEQGNLF